MAKIKKATVAKVEKITFASAKRNVAKFDPTAPDLETIFEDDGDPLEAVEYDENDLEASSDNEMTEIVRQIKAEKKAQYERFRIGRDPHYYLIVCFQSTDQRDEFAHKAGWDTVDGRFVNGLEVSKKLGLDVAAIPLKPLPQRGKPHLYRSEEVL